MSRRTRFHETCLKLKEKIADNTHDKNSGLCHNLRLVGDDWFPFGCIEQYSKSWKKNSGNWLYPVPGVNGSSAVHCYNFHALWEGEYGELRRELLDHMIYKSSKPAIIHFIDRLKGKSHA